MKMLCAKDVKQYLSICIRFGATRSQRNAYMRFHSSCLGRCLFLRGTSKIRIAVTKEFIKKYTKTRSNYHPVLKLNYFKCRKTNEFNYSAGWFNYSAGWRSFQINHPSKEQNWRNLWGARGLTSSKEGS